MKKSQFISSFVGILFFYLLLPYCSSAHFVVGIVNDARDGTSANDRTVVLWNPLVGMQDNLTDVIGPNGNSGFNNVYLIDCELLTNGCVVGDELRVLVFNTPNQYTTSFVDLTVTGAGFDVMDNLTLNSPPNVSNFSVDDSLKPPTFSANQIDLIAASNISVNCSSIVEELDGNSLQNTTAKFFYNTTSFYEDSDDNNYHYTNNSCFVDSSYGNENQSEIICSFHLQYYSNSGNWNCIMNVEDNLSSSSNESDSTFVNPLLSVGLVYSVDFGSLQVTNVSDESIINVTNYGNVPINLSLSGYGISEGDNLSMGCSLTGNIPIWYEKYNLTNPNPGDLDLPSFEISYTNLTSNASIREFNLNHRQNDIINEAINETYWRIYVPLGVEGACSGNIIFGATQASGS